MDNWERPTYPRKGARVSFRVWRTFGSRAFPQTSCHIWRRLFLGVASPSFFLANQKRWGNDWVLKKTTMTEKTGQSTAGFLVFFHQAPSWSCRAFGQNQRGASRMAAPFARPWAWRTSCGSRPSQLDSFCWTCGPDAFGLDFEYVYRCVYVCVYVCMYIYIYIMNIS